MNEMIPFEEIDSRLKKLGKTRSWLAIATGRSEGAIRTALAPNADPKNRSTLLQKALTDAIEAEEARQRTGAVLPERITLEVTPEEFELINEAALAAGLTIKKWIIQTLMQAAHPPLAAEKHSEGQRRKTA